MRIKGIDSVIPDWPQGQSRRVEMPLGAIQSGQLIMEQWYNYGLAQVPFCIQCKAPLDLYQPPDGDVLMVCPNCGREWVKDNAWLRWEQGMLRRK